MNLANLNEFIGTIVTSPPCDFIEQKFMLGAILFAVSLFIATAIMCAVFDPSRL